jgi:hypothetical protein
MGGGMSRNPEKAQPWIRNGRISAPSGRVRVRSGRIAGERRICALLVDVAEKRPIVPHRPLWIVDESRLEALPGIALL